MFAKPTPDYILALGKVISGLFVVTAAHEDRRAAYLASFVQQVSFDPLLFAIACHPQRYPYGLIAGSRKFGLNIISEGDRILLKTFAKGHGPEEDPLASVDVEMREGIPLLKNALVGAVCLVVGETKPGDHVLFFGKPIAGIVFDERAKPWVHVRKSATTY